MAGDSFDVDLSTFGKIRPLTIEDLKRYSAADLDPHTVQVGQLLCRDIHFSSSGQRNLANAFDALPTNLTNRPVFEIGFGQLHVIHSILKSDEGFRLASVVGALAEYFTGSVIVELFLQLANTSGLPIEWRPLEHQWKRMVQTLYGVMAVSSIGTVFSNIEDACQMSHDFDAEVNVKQLLENFLQLNSLKNTGRRKLRAGGEAIWLAAVAEWLFGLRTAIISGSGSPVYLSQSTRTEEEADVVIVLVRPGVDDHLQQLSLSEKVLGARPIRGGRVTYERLFRSCFGDAFTSISEDLLAALVYSASSLVRHRLDEERPDWEYDILSQSSLGSEKSVGLADTLTAWFPELHRLSPRFRKYAKQTYDESAATFDKTYHEIRRNCRCPYCIGGGLEKDEEDPTPEKCSIAVAEFVVRISFVLVRLFVAPKLLPKRQGIIAFHRRYYQATPAAKRRADLAAESPSKLFTPDVAKLFGSSVDVIKSAALIFANAISPDIESETRLMGVTYSGLTILSTGAKDMVVADVPQAKGQTRRWKSAIQVTPGWVCLCGHESRLEVYVNVLSGIAYDDLTKLRSEYDSSKVRQLFKWSGRKMCTTIMHAGSNEEQQAVREGWYIMKEEGGPD